MNQSSGSPFAPSRSSSSRAACLACSHSFSRLIRLRSLAARFRAAFLFARAKLNPGSSSLTQRPNASFVYPLRNLSCTLACRFRALIYSTPFFSSSCLTAPTLPASIGISLKYPCLRA